jgi:hypothetical protein
VLPFLVGHDLNFNVAGLEDVLFDVNVGVAERRERLCLGHDKGIGEVGLFHYHAHAFAAAAGRRFDDYREAEFARNLDLPATVLPGEAHRPALSYMVLSGLGRMIPVEHISAKLAFRQPQICSAACRRRSCQNSWAAMRALISSLGVRSNVLSAGRCAERNLAAVGDQYFLKHSNTSMTKVQRSKLKSQLTNFKFGFFRRRVAMSTRSQKAAGRIPRAGRSQ